VLRLGIRIWMAGRKVGVMIWPNLACIIAICTWVGWRLGGSSMLNKARYFIH
jgi:hypothetical protein